MLTKQAQEEVYNAYYNQGVELALGQVKVAGKTKEVIKKMIQVPSAALGGLGVFGGVESLPKELRDEILTTLGVPGQASILGLGGAAGYAASGKAVDMADEGIKKLVQINNDLKYLQRKARTVKNIENSIPGLKSLRRIISDYRINK